MKKIISLLMVLCLMASLCSMSAFAEGLVPSDPAYSDVPIPQPIVSDATSNAPGLAEADVIPDGFKVGLVLRFQINEDDPNLNNQIIAYGDKPTDFVLSVDGTKNDENIVYGEDVVLFGNYGPYGWLDLNYLFEWLYGGSMSGLEFETGGYRHNILMKMIGFEMVATFVKDFYCGVAFSEEFLEENPHVNAKLDLRMYNDVDDPTGIRVGDTVSFYATPNFNLQNASNGGSTRENPIVLPDKYEVTKPIEITGNVYYALNNSSFDDDLSLASGVDSLFKLAKDASVTILGDFSNKEVELMRSMVSKDYCVSEGSIVVNGSHVLGDGSVCTVCGEKVTVTGAGVNVPATADNSNMPLWSLLFIGFAAVAVLTAKKKKA